MLIVHFCVGPALAVERRLQVWQVPAVSFRRCSCRHDDATVRGGLRSKWGEGVALEGGFRAAVAWAKLRSAKLCVQRAASNISRRTAEANNAHDHVLNTADLPVGIAQLARPWRPMQCLAPRILEECSAIEGYASHPLPIAMASSQPALTTIQAVSPCSSNPLPPSSRLSSRRSIPRSSCPST